jgi:hypothetical protein
MDDFNPTGKKLGPSIRAYLIDTFKFEKYPTRPDQLDDTKGVVFEDGEFKNRKDEIIKIKLTIFNFGVMGETGSSTTDSDDFLGTFLNQLHENFKISSYKDIIKNKNYYGQLYVSTDKQLELINPKLKEISDYLSKNTIGHGDVHYKLNGLHFWADQLPVVKPPIFTLERQTNVPFSENRYFSAAGLETEKHINLLDRLEAILEG